jgi:hypothetical protein
MLTQPDFGKLSRVRAAMGCDWRYQVELSILTKTGCHACRQQACFGRSVPVPHTHANRRGHGTQQGHYSRLPTNMNRTRCYVTKNIPMDRNRLYVYNPAEIYEKPDTIERYCHGEYDCEDADEFGGYDD